MSKDQCAALYEILKEMAVKHKMHVLVAVQVAACTHKRTDSQLTIIDYPDLLKVTK
jgi:hypothetical protein